MKIEPLDSNLKNYLKKHNLEKKFASKKRLFELNWRHPSLRVELLEPKHRRIYAFRLDRKYRVLFFIEKGKVIVFSITKHYRK